MSEETEVIVRTFRVPRGEHCTGCQHLVPYGEPNEQGAYDICLLAFDVKRDKAGLPLRDPECMDARMDKQEGDPCPYCGGFIRISEDVSRHCPRCEALAAEVERLQVRVEWLRARRNVWVSEQPNVGGVLPYVWVGQGPMPADEFYAALAAATGTETAPFDVESILTLISEYKAGYPEETWPDVASQLPDAWQSWGERAAAQMARRTCDALTRRIRESQTTSAHAAQGE